MSARKLSDADKKAILEQYRQPGETTLTIANRYGVSNSTISRMLKSSLSPQEYEALIQQKRSARNHSPAAEDTPKESASEEKNPLPQPNLSESNSIRLPQPNLSESDSIRLPQPNLSESDSIGLPQPNLSESDSIRRRRRRSSAPLPIQPQKRAPIPPPIQRSQMEPVESISAVDVEEEEEKEPYDMETLNVEGEEFDRMEELEDFEDDDDLSELDPDESDEEMPTRKERTQVSGLVQVLPLDLATLPKICYLVVDRGAELITRPLKDFGDLGQIPPQEVLEKTLPIFDNHRVARRFANRSQRVTKIPDGKMLQKVKPYLQAKGITRVLIDGQVYSL